MTTLGVRKRRRRRGIEWEEKKEEQGGSASKFLSIKRRFLLLNIGRSVVMGQVIEVNLLDCTDVVVREDTIKLLLRSDKMILRWASPIIS